MIPFGDWIRQLQSMGFRKPLDWALALVAEPCQGLSAFGYTRFGNLVDMFNFTVAEPCECSLGAVSGRRDLGRHFSVAEPF